MKPKVTIMKEEQWGRGGHKNNMTVQELLKNHKALTVRHTKNTNP